MDAPAVCRIIGSILHDYYVAVENIFKSVAKRVDGSLMTSENWHKELLEQMTLEVFGVRPAVISLETFALLDELRGFRHVFRHVYGFSLAPERIMELVKGLPQISLLLKKDLKIYTEQVEKMIL